MKMLQFVAMLMDYFAWVNAVAMVTVCRKTF